MGWIHNNLFIYIFIYIFIIRCIYGYLIWDFRPAVFLCQRTFRSSRFWRFARGREYLPRVAQVVFLRTADRCSVLVCLSRWCPKVNLSVDKEGIRSRLDWVGLMMMSVRLKIDLDKSWMFRFDKCVFGFKSYVGVMILFWYICRFYLISVIFLDSFICVRVWFMKTPFA